MNDTGPKPFAFVLMPFQKKFDDVYEVGIKPACKDAGAYCERVDKQIFEERILERIYNQIAKADIIISDMTGTNPNVFYETGYAHALGKRVILLTQRAKDIPFDLSQYPHVIYGGYGGRIARLKGDLESKVRWYVENPKGPAPQLDFGLELFASGVRLRSDQREEVTCGCTGMSAERSYVHLKIDLHNPSSRVFAERLDVGIVTPKLFLAQRPDPSQTVGLPDGTNLHFRQHSGELMPSGWQSISFQLVINTATITAGPYDAMVRLFTRSGPRDFSLRLLLSAA